MGNAIKRTIVALMVVIVVFFSAPVAATLTGSSIAGVSITAEAASKKIHLKKKKITLTTGESYTQKLLDKNDKTISASKVKWSTSSKKIATVNSSGKVVAKSKGKTKITATYKGKKYTFTVTVKDATLKYKTKTLYLGKSVTQKLEDASGDSISSKSITWKSSDKKIATVSSKGKIVAKKAGKVKIYSTYKGKKYTATITVKNPSIKLNETELEFTDRDTVTLKATVSPSGEKVKWKSSNESVAKVSSKGKITPLKSGKTTITAYIKYSGNSKTYKATCSVTVDLPGDTYKNPLSGQSGEIIVLNDYISEKEIIVDVADVLYGSQANDLAESENPYNEAAGNGFEWRFIFLDIDYISSSEGLNDRLWAADVISDMNIYTTKGRSVQVKDIATLSNRYEGQGIYDIELYPESFGSVVFGVLIPEDTGELLLKIDGSDDSCTWIELIAPDYDDDYDNEYDENIFENVEYLKSYIKKYGSTNSSGNKFIKTVIDDDTYSHTAAIVYDYSNDCLTFIFAAESYDSDSALCTSLEFSMNYDSIEEYVEAIVLFYMYGELDGSAGAYSVVDIYNYDEDTYLDFYWADSSTGYIATEDTEDYLNSTLQYAFTGWEYLINSETGLTMSDIGFVSYN